MRINDTKDKLLRVFVGLSFAGVLLGTSCATEGLQAIVAGLDAAADSLANADDDDHMNFGEWLLSELED